MLVTEKLSENELKSLILLSDAQKYIESLKDSENPENSKLYVLFSLRRCTTSGQIRRYINDSYLKGVHIKNVVEGKQVNGKMYTTKEWLKEFIVGEYSSVTDIK